MKILGLKAENYKRLSAVELTIDENETLIEICGANGAGKSSVLDAIWETIGGRPATSSEPIRHGEETAEVSVRLGDGEDEYIARRRWKRGGKSTITLSEKRVGSVKSPQAILDLFLARVAFDPGELLNAADTKQVEMIRLAAGLQFADLDEKKDFLLNQRRMFKAKVLDTERDVEKLYQSAPKEDPGDVQDSEELRDLVRRDSTQLQRSAKATFDIVDIEERLTSAKSTILALEQKLAKKKEDVGHFVMAEEEIFSVKQNIVETEKKLDNIYEHKEKVREWENLQTLKRRLYNEAQVFECADSEIKKVDAEKKQRIAEMKLPIDGLGFSDDGKTVLFNNIPFSQSSSSERVRIAMALAIVQNPNLKVIQIRDGSLLDSDSLAQIADMAEENGFQVWVERVDETGLSGIVIEDGEIVADNRVDLDNESRTFGDTQNYEEE